MARTDKNISNKRQTTYDNEVERQPYINTSTAPELDKQALKNPIRDTSKRVSRNREHAAQINFKTLVFLLIAIAITAYILVDYVTLQSEIISTTVEISRLERQLNDLQTENAEMSTRILASMDLDEILRIAKEELGMNYATTGQIIPFTRIKGDYVQQKKEIPVEE
ncbi:MAG: hypothetical protein R3Y54_05665 [Eubacteriales bacterium]